jgi:hypothetical protein
MAQFNDLGWGPTENKSHDLGTDICALLNLGIPGDCQPPTFAPTRSRVIARRSTSRDDQSVRSGSPDGRPVAARKVTRPMIAFGVVLLIAALLTKLAVLWAVGTIVLIMGVILAVLGGMGRAVGGRRHYY